MKKLIIIKAVFLVVVLCLISLFASCSSEETTTPQAPELYPTEKCTLIFQGSGNLILIDKSKSIGDTIYKCTGSTRKTLQLIKRGYYEIKITNSNDIFLEVSNPTKVVANFQGSTNGLIKQFFNK
jgi:hypothetical protein